MAEFKAIVTASFDDIGSHVALNNIRALHPNRLAPPSNDEDKTTTTTTTTTRRSPFSFLRKVKSHATSLLVPQSQSQTQTQTQTQTSSSSRSFVPALPPTPPTAANSLLSRNLLTRAFGKQHPHNSPRFPDVEPKSSFFDDDDDEDDVLVDRRLFPQTRRISAAPARPNSRLSSAFAAAPTIFGLSSPSVSVSTPSLIPEKYGVVRPGSRADIIHVCAYLLLLDPSP